MYKSEYVRCVGSAARRVDAWIDAGLRRNQIKRLLNAWCINALPPGVAAWDDRMTGAFIVASCTAVPTLRWLDDCYDADPIHDIGKMVLDLYGDAFRFDGSDTFKSQLHPSAWKRINQACRRILKAEGKPIPAHLLSA